MSTALFLAMVSLIAATAGVGVAAIVNAVRVNKAKHGEQSGHHNFPAPG